VMLATGCLGLTSYTGSPVFDAMGSVMIGGTDYSYQNKAQALISLMDLYTSDHTKSHQKR